MVKFVWKQGSSCFQITHRLIETTVLKTNLNFFSTLPALYVKTKLFHWSSFSILNWHKYSITIFTLN
jgi:hypothetical protein